MNPAPPGPTALARGDRVELRDFGVFAVKRREARLLVLFGVRRQDYSTYEMRADGLPIGNVG